MLASQYTYYNEKANFAKITHKIVHETAKIVQKSTKISTRISARSIRETNKAFTMSKKNPFIFSKIIELNFSMFITTASMNERFLV